MITSVERNALEAAIDRARVQLETAKAIARAHHLSEVLERLEWSRDFLAAANDKLAKEET